jgi:hypothetical protein
LELWSFGALELWSFGALELWSFGALELYTTPICRKQAHFQVIMSLLGAFIGWRPSVHDALKTGRGWMKGKNKW